MSDVKVTSKINQTAVRDLDKLLSQKILIGILGAEATQRKKDHDGSMSEKTLVEIAALHEFGAPSQGIPRRSFLRDWLNLNESRVARTLQAIITQGDWRKGLLRFGAWCVGEVQKRISKGISPANAPSTIQRKGSSKPLIDTGQLRSSIAFAVPGLGLTGSNPTPTSNKPKKVHK